MTSEGRTDRKPKVRIYANAMGLGTFDSPDERSFTQLFFHLDIGWAVNLVDYRTAINPLSSIYFLLHIYAHGPATPSLNCRRHYNQI